MQGTDVYNQKAMKQRDLDRVHFLKNFQNLVLQYDHIVLFHHLSPDGDCLGASFALKEIIQTNYPNKRAYVVGGNRSRAYGFMNMKFDNEINPDFDFASAMAVIVDVGQSERIDSFDRFFRNDRFRFGAVVKIDHHDTVSDFHVDLAWDDPTYVSTCCQIIQISDYYGWVMTPRAATFLYLGCMTDSMRFSTVTVLPRTHILAAKALRAGADAPFLLENMNLRTWAHLEMTAYLIGRAVRTDHIIYGVVDAEAERRFGIESAKSLISTYGNVEGRWVWMLAVEREEDGILEVSIRSVHVSSRDLALKYRGGGHEFAAGCRVSRDEFEALINDANVMVANAKRDRARRRHLSGSDDVSPEMMERTREAVIRRNPEVVDESRRIMEEIGEERASGAYDADEGKRSFAKGAGAKVV